MYFWANETAALQAAVMSGASEAPFRNLSSIYRGTHAHTPKPRGLLMCMADAHC
jgi:hypothetical protein